MAGKARPRSRTSLGGWTEFAVIFASVWLLHAWLLRLPYFWDEAGYFIPAARDLLLTGDLIPHTTLSNAHPPLVMLWLALCWKLTTYSVVVTRTAMLLVAAFGLTGLYRLARLVAGSEVAAATVVLTALYPTVYSQSAMAQLDIAAFALVLWTLYEYVSGRRWQAMLFAALAGVAKETTVAVTLTLLGLDLLGWAAGRWWPQWTAKWLVGRGGVEARLERKDGGRKAEQPGLQFGLQHNVQASLWQCAGWLLALLPLVGWYGYHFHRTGHVFGNPDYLRYNVGATLTPLRILLAGLMRLWNVSGYMNLFVLTAAALVLLWDARTARNAARLGNAVAPLPGALAPAVQLLLVVVVLAQVAEFSVVGGALLARYMIPAVPLVVLWAVNVLRNYAPSWKWWVAGCAVAFVAALLFNPPWFISPEDNLTWTHFVGMHERAAEYVEQHYGGERGGEHGGERILTAWPASDELNRPFLGYVSRPLTVVRIENFSAEEVLKAAGQVEGYDVVVAFSSKYEPPRGLWQRIPGWRQVQTRYFDFHEDLGPKTIAHLLHGRVVWQEASVGEWIAVMEIDKIRDAEVRGVERGMARH